MVSSRPETARRLRPHKHNVRSHRHPTNCEQTGQSMPWTATERNHRLPPKISEQETSEYVCTKSQSTATKSAIQGSPSAAPATKSALRGSPSAVPATKSALRGSPSAAPATKSHFEVRCTGCTCHEICTSRFTKRCTCHKISTSRFTKCCACHEFCASRFTYLKRSVLFEVHKALRLP